MSDQEKEAQTTPDKAFIIIDAQVFPIVKPVTTIGRKLVNDFVLQSPQVSRVHAEIRFEDGGFVLHDLNSTSGTFVNNQKIKESKIFSGDLIRIAGVPMMFVDETDVMHKGMEKGTDRLKKKGNN
jgi:predicted component of type VI protein secretion system